MQCTPIPGNWHYIRLTATWTALRIDNLDVSVLCVVNSLLLSVVLGCTCITVTLYYMALTGLPVVCSLAAEGRGLLECLRFSFESFVIDNTS